MQGKMHITIVKKIRSDGSLCRKSAEVSEKLQEEKTHVYTKYSRFLKEVLGHQTSESEEINEIMAQNPDLDFL